MRPWVTASVVWLACGCSLLTSVSDLTGGAPDGSSADASSVLPEGGVGDASDVDVDVDVDAGPPNLLDDSSFEAGCSGWGRYLASASSSPLARTGTSACRMCLAGDAGDFFSIDRNAVTSPPIGATYRVEAWVRADPASASGAAAYLFVRTMEGGPSYAEHDKAAGGSVVVSDVWQRLTVTLDVVLGGPQLNVVVTAKNAAKACLLVDDVVVQRLR